MIRELRDVYFARCQVHKDIVEMTVSKANDVANHRHDSC